MNIIVIKTEEKNLIYYVCNRNIADPDGERILMKKKIHEFR